jgi:hypothetical protein
MTGRPLRLEDAAWIAPAARAALSPLSESAVAKLYLFRDVHGYRVVEGALPHVTGAAYDGQDVVLPLFDVVAAPLEAVREILGASRSLYPVDEARAAALAEHYEGGFSEADSDYVYDAARMRTLAGAKTRRLQAERFEAAAGPRIELIDTPEADRAAAQVLDQWLADVAKPWAATDYAACREAIASRQALGLFGLIVHAGREPGGFVLASEIAPDMAAIHFAKGLRSLDGIFPYMFRRFAQAHTQYTWLNFEQDLGHPGFRQAKRSYRPARLQRKYRLRLRG